MQGSASGGLFVSRNECGSKKGKGESTCRGGAGSVRELGSREPSGGCGLETRVKGLLQVCV